MIQNRQEQAVALGISLSHYDIDGNLIYAPPPTLDYFIQALQKNVGSAEFADVLCGVENTELIYDLSSLSLPQPISISYQLINEEQFVFAENTCENQQITLPPLSYGYYQLVINSKAKQLKVQVLVSPEKSYQPEVFKDHKSWGINVQLYSLRSQHNWGIGDFGDLAYLVEQSAKLGADFIGINPLHLLYPSVPEWASPYSASSRRWWNFIYLDVPSISEFRGCRRLKNWLKTPEIVSTLNSLREQDTVDYSKVHDLKLYALKLVFEFSHNSQEQRIIERRKAFKHYFRKNAQALKMLGLFNVLDGLARIQNPQQEYIGYLGWPEEWQNLSRIKIQRLCKEHQNEIEFWAWVQWLCEEQLDALQQSCQDHGMKLGIYGDLAVASSRGSFDIWENPERYLPKAAIGAPPDPLGPIGQNWNLPPLNPNRLRETGFAEIIATLRANMQYFGVLRIDHVMGLFRLWLIPENQNAAAGAYVHYPFKELIAILAIESVRNQCLIIGEDLGTVPNEVRHKLNELSIFSYFVLYFAANDNDFPAPQNFPENAFATVGTHDVPSLQSFWHCRDLELFSALGILQGELLRQKYDKRVSDKQALLNSLHHKGFLPPTYQGDALSMAMHDNLNLQIHRYLAQSRSKLIGVQLENILSQEVSFNLPGTDAEYPNWRHKISQSLELIFSNEHYLKFFQAIDRARKA